MSKHDGFIEGVFEPRDSIRPADWNQAPVPPDARIYYIQDVIDMLYQIEANLRTILEAEGDALAGFEALIGKPQCDCDDFDGDHNLDDPDCLETLTSKSIAKALSEARLRLAATDNKQQDRIMRLQAKLDKAKADRQADIERLKAHARTIHDTDAHFGLMAIIETMEDQQ